MGFFSKVCAKTNKPVVHEGRGVPALSKIVVLYPDGRKIEGEYDGYGRVAGQDLCPNGYTEKEWDAIKFVLASDYAGEKYEELGKSKDELAQGHFMSNAFLVYCLQIDKFSNYAAYKRAFNKLAGW